MLTEEIRTTWRKTCSCVPLCTANPTWISGGEINFPHYSQT